VFYGHSWVVYKLQTINPGCPPSLHFPFDQLVFDETFAQPCIFAVVNCADVEPCVFYSPVFTRWQIFCNYELLCLRRPLLIYVHYSDALYILQQRVKSACRMCTATPENGGMVGHCPLCPLKWGQRWREANMSFHSNFVGNFMVYQHRLETNLYSYFGTLEIPNDFL